MNASSESEHESNNKGHDGRTEKQEKDEDDLGEREEAEGATKDEMTNICNPGGKCWEILPLAGYQTHIVYLIKITYVKAFCIT